jgi:acetoin utilization deacetylase AcuC-like enzyme
LHRYPHYPGTGYLSEANCLNFPLSAYTGDKKYLEKFDEALSQLDIEKYELVAISAGFDCHEGDLASLGLSSDCFGKIGKRIGALRKPVFGVLEGGYVGENIGNDLHELIQGLEG